MTLLHDWPWLLAMLVLALLSGLFSASEAALFSLTWNDRKQFAAGGRLHRLADRLLSEPDRLLSAILFANLLVNMGYFAIASILSVHAQRQSAFQAGMLATGALLALILCGEMLPKTLGVMLARPMSAWVAAPLALIVRAIGPLMPMLRTVQLLSRRLIWPGFRSEPALQASDLERALARTRADKQLATGEGEALRNLLLLSDVLVEEWMRPRAQFRTFRSPARLEDLGGELTPSGYLLLTAADDSETIVSAVDLRSLVDKPIGDLDVLAREVVYVPWCATVADALELMQGTRRSPVAVVVNEYGETIGVLTLEDVLDTVFTYHPSRSKLLLDAKPIHDLAPGRWLVAGVTSLRRLSRYLGRELPPSKSVTLHGAVQDTLQRLAVAGDAGRWGPFEFKVLEAPQRGHMLIELALLPEAQADNEGQEEQR